VNVNFTLDQLLQAATKDAVAYRILESGLTEYLVGSRGVDGLLSFGYMPDVDWIFFNDLAKYDIENENTF
jgi:hypothetical protein